MKRPLIAITMGDPAGIGPEIVVRAWPEGRLHSLGLPFVVGDPSILQAVVNRHRLPVQIVSIGDPAEAAPSPALLPCLSIESAGAYQIQPGCPGVHSGEQAYQAIVKGTRLVLQDRAQGLVTGPISKSTLHAGGYPWPGHTELLAELCGVKHSSMMLYLPPGVVPAVSGLGIVHVTLHISLRRALDAITQTGIVRAGELVSQLMSRIGRVRGSLDSPRLGVCALNPHAGEEGLFGDEEIAVIAPAVRQLRDMGYRTTGPLPADTMFARAFGGEFDAVVAMYHDQGHIAVKLKSMFSAVNITLGLPIVRTSVAHGTAFSIAGQGIADYRGLLAAAETCGALIRSPALPRS